MPVRFVRNVNAENTFTREGFARKWIQAARDGVVVASQNEKKVVHKGQPRFSFRRVGRRHCFNDELLFGKRDRDTIEGRIHAADDRDGFLARKQLRESPGDFVHRMSDARVNLNVQRGLFQRKGGPVVLGQSTPSIWWRHIDTHAASVWGKRCGFQRSVWGY